MRSKNIGAVTTSCNWNCSVDPWIQYHTEISWGNSIASPSSQFTSPSMLPPFRFNHYPLKPQTLSCKAWGNISWRDWSTKLWGPIIHWIFLPLSPPKVQWGKHWETWGFSWMSHQPGSSCNAHYLVATHFPPPIHPCLLGGTLLSLKPAVSWPRSSWEDLWTIDGTVHPSF